MAPDTQSIDCTATFLTLGLALSHPFDTPGDDPEYSDRETLSAAIKRVGLDDDDEDDDDVDEEEDEDDFNEKAVDDEDDEEYVGPDERLAARARDAADPRDTGTIARRRGADVAYLDQDPTFDPALTPRLIVEGGLAAWSDAKDRRSRPWPMA